MVCVLCGGIRRKSWRKASYSDEVEMSDFKSKSKLAL